MRQTSRWAGGVLALVLAFVPSFAKAQEAGACADGVEGFECLAAQPLDREFVSRVVGAPRGEPLQGEELARRSHEIGLLLRCPVCQGTSVSDSPSPTAINMKGEIADLLAAGYDEAQILAYFEAAYGQFVLLSPKAEGLGLLVWIAPAFALVIGGVVVASALRRLRGEPEAGVTPDEGGAEPPAKADGAETERQPIDPDLERRLRQVRELAYGRNEPEGESES